jgi:tRNA-dihydrouridine synthase
MYQNSVFALTYRKGGWDCFRHYEILMNGCIPLHLEINKCPDKTLEKIPKDLLKKILIKYEWILSNYNPFFIYKYKFLDIKKIMLFLISSIKSNKNLENFIHNNEEVFEIKKQLLNYTKNNLTTEVMAKEVIEKFKSL